MYIDVRLRLNEADKARVSSEVGAISPGSPGAAGGGAGGRGSSSSAVLLAQARLEAAQARLNIGPEAQASTLIARSADERIRLVGRLGLETSGTLKQASIAEAAVRRAESEGRRADARELSWATRSFREARRGFDAADRAEASWAVSSFREARRGLESADRAEASWAVSSFREARSEFERDEREVGRARQSYRRAMDREDRNERAAAIRSFRSARRQQDSDEMGWAVSSFRSARREVESDEDEIARARRSVRNANEKMDRDEVNDAVRRFREARTYMDRQDRQANIASRAANDPRNRWYNQQVMSTGMLMQVMFGGWEAASAMRLGGENYRLSQRPTMQNLEKMGMNIDRMTSGPLGSLVRMPAESAEAISNYFGLGYKSQFTSVREAIESANRSTLITQGKASEAAITMNESTRLELARNSAQLLNTNDQFTKARVSAMNARDAVESEILMKDKEFKARIAAYDENDPERIKVVNENNQFVADAEIRRKEAGIAYSAAMERIKQDIARGADSLRRQDLPLYAAAEGQYGAATRAQLLASNAQSLFDAPMEWKGIVASQNAMRLQGAIQQGRDQARSAYGAGLAVNGGVAGQLVQNVIEGDLAIRSAAPEARQATAFLFAARTQALLRQNSAITTGLRNDNRILDILNSNNPNADTLAQGQGIVDSAISGFAGATGPQQQLILSRANKQLDLLQRQQVNPIGVGTPGLFVGGSAPLADLDAIRKQLLPGLVGAAAAEAINSGSSGFSGGSAKLEGLAAEIRDLLKTLTN